MNAAFTGTATPWIARQIIQAVQPHFSQGVGRAFVRPPATLALEADPLENHTAETSRAAAQTAPRGQGGQKTGERWGHPRIF
jgi:hypothetical protein